MKDYYPSFFWQTREMLVREIRDAQTWSGVESAALALLKVINLGTQLRDEAEYLSGDMADETNNTEVKGIRDHLF